MILAQVSGRIKILTIQHYLTLEQIHTPQIDTHIISSSNVHGATGSIVGTIDIQTLTHKTIDDIINKIAADKLHSATTTTSLNTATAPTINQALIAIGGTGATFSNDRSC